MQHELPPHRPAPLPEAEEESWLPDTQSFTAPSTPTNRSLEATIRTSTQGSPLSSSVRYGIISGRVLCVDGRHLSVRS